MVESTRIQRFSIFWHAVQGVSPPPPGFSPMPPDLENQGTRAAAKAADRRRAVSAGGVALEVATEKSQNSR